MGFKSFVSAFVAAFATFIQNVWKPCSIYLFWICVHYAATHLYIYMCAPDTIMGFILSPLMVVTPQCKAVRWVLFNSLTVIDHMWLVLTTWAISVFLQISVTSADA